MSDLREQRRNPAQLRETLDRLAEKIAAIEGEESPHASSADRPRVPTGWAEVDDLLRGGLAAGAVHEWMTAPPHAVSSSRASVHTDSRSVAKRFFHSVSPSLRLSVSSSFSPPPLSILIHLAFQSILHDESEHRAVIWIGKTCQPYIRSLLRHHPGEDRRLLRRSIFVDLPVSSDPREVDLKVWAIDLAARCPAVAAVVADGSGLDMAASRRLQLAAKTGHALVLLARPGRELAQLSAAATRWLTAPLSTSDVQPAPDSNAEHPAFKLKRQKNFTHDSFPLPVPSSSPRWIVQLLRCKGVQPARANVRERLGPLSFVLELNRETRLVRVSADVVDRSAQTKTRARSRPEGTAVRRTG